MFKEKIFIGTYWLIVTQILPRKIKRKYLIIMSVINNKIITNFENTVLISQVKPSNT